MGMYRLSEMNTVPVERLTASLPAVHDHPREEELKQAFV